MNTSTTAKVALVGAASLALVLGGMTTTAFAATPADSAQPVYYLDGNSGDPLAAGSTLHWNTSVIGTPVKTNYDATFTGSSDAETTAVFLAPAGQERTVANWAAYSPGGFVSGTKNVLQPTFTLSNLSNGNPLAVKASGGEYSVGVAWLKNNGLTLANAGVVYTRVHIAAGGDYTFDSPTETGGGTTTPPASNAGTGSVDLSATTVAGAEGNLSLVVPSGAKATIGNPTLVNGLSTSTGTLGQITVKDGRFTSHPGWDLTSSVADFVNGSTTIAAKQLGIKPKLISGPGAVATGNTAGTASDGKFANATNSATVGDTVVDADLTFVAPAASPAGTYTSKMTLTLVSK